MAQYQKREFADETKLYIKIGEYSAMKNGKFKQKLLPYILHITQQGKAICNMVSRKRVMRPIENNR